MATVNELKFSLIYADDFAASKAFYEKYFGFKEEFEMPDSELGPQTWGMTGEVGMWIGGGYMRGETTDHHCRTGVMFGVDSAGALFTEFTRDKVPTVQQEPVEMQPGMFWFQFKDPSGNLIDVLGGA